MNEGHNQRTLYFGLGVVSAAVEVALAVVGPHDAAQLAVERRVEALVRREDHHAPRVPPPADAVPAHHNLDEQCDPGSVLCSLLLDRLQ